MSASASQGKAKQITVVFFLKLVSSVDCVFCPILTDKADVQTGRMKSAWFTIGTNIFAAITARQLWQNTRGSWEKHGHISCWSGKVDQLIRKSAPQIMSWWSPSLLECPNGLNTPDKSNAKKNINRKHGNRSRSCWSIKMESIAMHCGQNWINWEQHGNVETSTIINGNGGNSVVGKMIFSHRVPTPGILFSHTGCQSTVTGAEFMVNQVDNVETICLGMENIKEISREPPGPTSSWRALG